jgi:hypothetical protein
LGNHEFEFHGLGIQHRKSSALRYAVDVKIQLDFSQHHVKWVKSTRIHRKLDRILNSIQNLKLQKHYTLGQFPKRFTLPLDGHIQQAVADAAIRREHWRKSKRNPI